MVGMLLRTSQGPSAPRCTLPLAVQPRPVQIDGDSIGLVHDVAPMRAGEGRRRPAPTQSRQTKSRREGTGVSMAKSCSRSKPAGSVIGHARRRSCAARVGMHRARRAWSSALATARTALRDRQSIGAFSCDDHCSVMCFCIAHMLCLPGVCQACSRSPHYV